jgi:hypothetical protein
MSQGPARFTTSKLEKDLQGCEKGDRHCHSRKRGERAVLPNGKVKVCHRPAGWGTDHAGTGTCRSHLGTARNHNTHAEADQVSMILSKYGEMRDIDPGSALLEEVRRTAGIVAWWERVVQGLDPETLTWGVSETTEEPGAAGESVIKEIRKRASPATALLQYQTERKHLVLVCKAALDAGISQRLIDVFTDVGQTFVSLFERVMEGLDLSAAQAMKVPELMTRELAGLAGDMRLLPGTVEEPEPHGGWKSWKPYP